VIQEVFNTPCAFSGGCPLNEAEVASNILFICLIIPWPERKKWNSHMRRMK